MTMAHSYASIVKYDKHDDGTLTVYGKATDGSLDIDLQICDPAWLDRAMPEWFKSGGNIREQHSSIAAGVATEYERKGDGHYIEALVVDPVSVKKVEARVLKGFSIGIKSPRVVRDQKAANGRIIDGQIVEVSLVDRPANPNAKLMLAKSVDGNVVQVEELVEQPPAAILAKFDKAQFETARTALAGLIEVEAGELALGHDERMSLHHLMEAVSHLLAWYDGEAMEGEVPEEETMQEDTLELAADSDEEKCADCGESMKACKCSKEADAEKSVEGEEAPVEESQAEEPVVEDDPQPQQDSDGTASESIEELVDKAVQAALAGIKAEVASLLTANEAEKEKSAGLEAQVAELLTKAAGGGPKRTGRTLQATLDDNEVKAAQFRAKAAAATDPLLAKGYSQLATEFAAKAASADNL